MRCFSKYWMIAGLFVAIPIVLFGSTIKKEEDFKDLRKKTARGFVVRYTLRYDPENWSFRSVNGAHEFSSLKNGGLKATVWADSEEKNVTASKWVQKVQTAANNSLSEPSLYVGYELKPSEMVTINGINFLLQSVIVNLAPNSVHIKTLGKYDTQKRNIPASGSQDQFNYYICSGDKGTVYIKIEAQSLISQSDQESIDELFSGFSFDGSASRGPKGLRALKSAVEFLTD